MLRTSCLKLNAFIHVSCVSSAYLISAHTYTHVHTYTHTHKRATGLYRALTLAAQDNLLNDAFFWIPSLAGPASLADQRNVRACVRLYVCSKKWVSVALPYTHFLLFTHAFLIFLCPFVLALTALCIPSKLIALFISCTMCRVLACNGCSPSLTAIRLLAGPLQELTS